MIRIVADNIISPLGRSTEDNVQAVRRGETALREHRLEGMPESFVASLLDPALGFVDGLIATITASLESAARQGEKIDPQSGEVIFIVSSTKGNVADFECLGASAEKVSRHFGNPNHPIVVSNACISGLAAQILAQRLLTEGQYKYAIVAGMDVQGKFIVSGFQSFKALSPEPCRPFDGDRCGLNLGEAAASMILSNTPGEGWYVAEGYIRNDANHISNPLKTGEGCLCALQQVGADHRPLTCISAHGTATIFNDEMEACAIDRAGLAEVPTFSLKGYYGHTMGAAGLLETIITLHAVEEGWIPATQGYAEEGTVHSIHVTREEEKAEGREVLKLLSGFGGCNAAVRYTLTQETESTHRPFRLKRMQSVRLTPEDMPQGMTAWYKEKVGDYPKFYKMDPLCKLGFLAAEELLRSSKTETEGSPKDDRAIVLFSRHGSMADDKAYWETVSHPEEYFPSPAVFVYTLSNIVTGEIAIRHHYMGETSCYILEEKDWPLMEQIMATTFEDKGIRSIVGGWVDYADETHFEADLALFERER